MTGAEWRKRSCGDKRQYPSRHRAKIAAQRAASSMGYDFETYRCKFCGYHHLARTKAAKIIAEIIDAVKGRGK